MRIGKASPFLLRNVEVDIAQVFDVLRRGITVGYELVAGNLLTDVERNER
jgi:hypothetical protein